MLFASKKVPEASLPLLAHATAIKGAITRLFEEVCKDFQDIDPNSSRLACLEHTALELMRGLLDLGADPLPWLEKNPIQAIPKIKQQGY